MEIALRRAYPIAIVLSCLLWNSWSHAYTLNIEVVPNTGTAQSLMILRGSGILSPGVECGVQPDFCFTQGWAEVDGNTVQYVPFCGTSFWVNLQDAVESSPSCGACLWEGTHTVKFYGITGCSGWETPFLCAQTTFEIIPPAQNGDPWQYSPELRPPNQTFDQAINISFNPCEVEDVPLCDSIVYIQVARAVDQNGNPLTHAQQNWPDAAKLDAVTTASGYYVDVGADDPEPYYPPVYSTRGYKLGVPTPCQAAGMRDDPSRPPSSYTATTTKITITYEAYAFCKQGLGRGLFLGRQTWNWEQPKPVSGQTREERTLPGVKDRSQPGVLIKEAIDQWCQVRKFTLPTPGIPKEAVGGSPCP